MLWVIFMKIVSWNCRQGLYLHDKFKKIRELDADIYVILEVNKPKEFNEDYAEFMKNSEVLLYDNGSTKANNYGIAVIAKEGITLENNNWDYEYNDFLSVRVNDSFDLVAVWTHNSFKIGGEWKSQGDKEYVRRIDEYLDLYGNEFCNSDNLIMCGDFNLDMSSDKPKNKEEFIYKLKDYGYESIYHEVYNENIGEESVKTFHRRDGDFHIDYLFTKPEIVSSFELGSRNEFVDCGDDSSDHVPLIFEVDL